MSPLQSSTAPIFYFIIIHVSVDPETVHFFLILTFNFTYARALVAFTTRMTSKSLRRSPIHSAAYYEDEVDELTLATPVKTPA